MNRFRRFGLFAMLVILLSACAGPGKTATPAPELAAPTLDAAAPSASGNSMPQSFLGLPWKDTSLYVPGLVQSQGVHSYLPGATIYHIELTIDPDLVHIKGREGVQYTNLEGQALEQVKLHLFPNLIGGKITLSNLTVNGQAAEPTYELNQGVLVVPLAQSLQPGWAIILGMEFELSVPTSAEANYGVLASLDDVLTLAHAYPMVAVYDENGWDTQAPSPWSDLTYADAAFYMVRVIAPADLTLVASGRQVSLDKNAETQTAVFALGPGRDFALGAAKGYDVVSRAVGEVTVNSYAPSDEMDNARSALETAAAAVEIFNERYAPYPYTELDLFPTPTSALGVEYPGLVAINLQLYAPDTGQFGGAMEIYRESTVAHETGHQWFYNLVGNDQLKQPWLDESLTQFATWQYYTDRYGQPGGDGYKAELEARWAKIDNQPIPAGKPASEYNGQEYSSIVYGRGALFFFALRDQLGQKGFDAFLKDYTQTYTWGLATTSGLKSLAGKDCGCDLEPLFAEWIYAK